MAANQDWVWIDPAVVHAVHDEQLAEHGGAAGVRDIGLLESALARPRNLALYGAPDVAELAASYAFGLARNHPFIDGNKRVGLEAALLFLEINDYAMEVSDEELIDLVLRTAQDQTTKTDIAEFFRQLQAR